MRKYIFAISCASALAMGLTGAESSAMRLYCAPERSLAWQTVASNCVQIAFAWPQGAVSANLDIRDSDGRTVVSETVAAGVASYEWEVFSGVCPASDDCFSVAVAYSDGDVILQTDTAVVALFTGTFAPVVAHVADSEKAFAITPSGRPIVYESEWFALEAGDMLMSATNRDSGSVEEFSVARSASGVFRWAPKETDSGRKWFDFLLEGSGTGGSVSGSGYLGALGMHLSFR